MDIGIKCNILEARYSLDKGMLRCVEPFSFVVEKEEKIQIEIKEIGIRIIKLSCEKEVEAQKMYSLLLKMERLLHIFDGAFIPLENIFIHGNGDKKHYNVMIEHLKVQRLHYFASAKFLSVQSDRFLNYENVLSASLFETWETLLDELGVVNQMYLYAASDCGLTNDVKCAFMVELAESLIEIIGKNNIQLQRNSPKEGELRPCLRTIINTYGSILFKREIQFDLEKILTCLVNMRVNIMHIKINQRKPCLNGAESTLYAIKMSYLYRLVIFEKLQIDKGLYIGNVEKRINYLNKWNDTLDILVKRLSDMG